MSLEIQVSCLMFTPVISVFPLASVHNAGLTCHYCPLCDSQCPDDARLTPPPPAVSWTLHCTHPWRPSHQYQERRALDTSDLSQTAGGCWHLSGNIMNATRLDFPDWMISVENGTRKVVNDISIRSWPNLTPYCCNEKDKYCGYITLPTRLSPELMLLKFYFLCPFQLEFYDPGLIQ